MALPTPPPKGPPSIKRAFLKAKRKPRDGGPLRYPAAGRVYLHCGYVSRPARRKLRLDSEPPNYGAGEGGLEGGAAVGRGHGVKRARLARLGH